jgi:hypothetical protein
VGLRKEGEREVTARRGGRAMGLHARGEMGQLGAAQRRSMHAGCKPQRGCQRQRPHVRATLSGLCLYAVVRAKLARVLDAKATRGEERYASAYAATSGRRQLGDGLNVLASYGTRRAMRSTAWHLEPCGLARQGRQCSDVASTQSSAVRGDTTES